MHVLPQLRELESRYAGQIAIVGVHRGKYTAERETLVAIDPCGYVVGMQAGEFTADALAPFIDRVLVGTLDEAGTTMRVEHRAGGPTAGYRDGRKPLFTNPQGLVFRGEELLVADSGNHVIRRLSLATGACDTLAGTGRPLRSAVDEAKGALSSPWDLALAGDTLHVAMAGIHQLWTVSLSSGHSAVLSGSGAEELHDARHADAALAQPMGLCVDGDIIWFVDAESSAVRSAGRGSGGAVHTIVGTGLFDFGDVDGTGDDVRLQHPQGIARAADGRLLICDSYNDALKWVDPVTRRVSTWVRGLHEPAGLALGQHHAYVADTNAHRIACVALESGEVRGLGIRN